MINLMAMLIGMLAGIPAGIWIMHVVWCRPFNGKPTQEQYDKNVEYLRKSKIIK